MKKAFKSILHHVFLLLLATALVACNAKGDNSEITTNEEKNTDFTNANPDFDPNLPDKTFEDETVFTFAGRWKENNDNYQWNNTDIVVEGITGNQIDDAVFRRNSYIEEKYNILIEFVKCGDCGAKTMGSKMSQFIHTNALTCDIEINAILASPYDTVGYAMSGLIINLDILDYVNFEKDWWDQNAVKNLNFGGKKYMMSGDVSIVDNKAVHVYAFNKTMIEDLVEIPNMYEIVRNKEWTFEKLFTYSEMAWSDIDNNGADMNDIYGFSYWQDAAYTFITSSGLTFAEFNADGKLEMTISNDRFVTVWGKVIDKLKNSAGVFDRIAVSKKTNGADDGSSVFNEGRALFAWYSMGSLMNIRTSHPELNYGIIPSPLYDENQADYITTPHTYGFTMLSVPTNNYDSEILDKEGYILEAFSAASREYVLPMFYDIVLTYKTAKAEEDAEMLDLIYSKIKYDIGTFMNFNNFGDEIITLFNNKNAAIGTWYAGAETAIQTEIEKVSKLFE